MMHPTPKTLALALAFLGATAPAAFGQTAVPADQVPPLTTPDFIRAAAQSDEFEAQEGRLAQTRSTNPEIRAYGAKMIQDHGMTSGEMNRAIAASGMTPPPPVRLTPEQYAMLKALTDLQGPAFDAEYARQAVLSHRDALGLHQEYNLKGDNPAIVEASKLATPMIKEHLRLADNLVLAMRPPQL